MNYPRYTEYKESGFDWLGQVPKHWELEPLKHNFRIVGGSTPKSDQSEFWDGEIIWVTPADLSKLQSIYINDSKRKISQEGLSSCGTTLVPANSIVLSTRAPIGSLGIAGIELCTNQGCKSLVPLENICTKYYTYMLGISSVELNIRGKGTTFLELSSDELGIFKVSVPSFQEQTGIAAFIDRETAKIDELISKQQRLIDLLQEKRQAIISHAVTKGLNPEAPMKDSGVEWLGQVPEHWGLRSLRHSAKIINGSDFKHVEVTSGGYPVLGSGGEFARVSTYLFDQPSVLLGRKGTIDNPLYIEEPFWTVDTLFYTEIAKDTLPKYFYYFCKTIPFDCFQFGSTVPSMTQRDLYSIYMSLPTFEEQTAIAAFLDSETAKIDTLVNEAQNSISLLKERRKAVIFAAVTGKIDVRELCEKVPA